MKKSLILFIFPNVLLSLLFSEQKLDHIPKKAYDFLDQHCMECHDEDIQKGDFDLSDLDLNLNSIQTFETWVKIYEKVEHQDMPPKKKKQPSSLERSAFLAFLNQPLLKKDFENQKEVGRARVRRLNRVEFETTLSDLFQMPLDIQNLLPEDAKGDGFDTVGGSLNVSSVQIEAYLEAIELVLDQATKLYQQPIRKKYPLSYLQSGGIMQEYRRTNSFHVTPDGPVFFSPQLHSFLNPLLGQYAIPYDGTYKVSVQAQAKQSNDDVNLTVRLGGLGHDEKDNVPKTVLGYIEVSPKEIQTFHFEEHLVRGQAFRIYPTALPFMRFTGKKWEMNQHKYKGKGVLVHKVIVDGPIFESWPPASHNLLWDKIPTKRIPGVKDNKNHNAALDLDPTKIAMPKMTRIPKENRNKETAGQWKYDPSQQIGGEKIYRNTSHPEPFHRTHTLAPIDQYKDSIRLIKNFIPKAFRRKVSSEETQPYIDLVHHWLKQGVDFEEAMRTGYKAILTSPEFLYFKHAFDDKNDKISDLALAERLAYFLWSSAPDQELLNLAENKNLSKPSLLQQQVERMLKDSKSERFLDNFLGQWLDLRLMDFTAPDTNLYPEFDPILKYSMKEETISFFKELLKDNLSVRHIIDSDFIMANKRLAEHYQLPKSKGMKMQKVTLPNDSPRGGVIGMASIHKVTANGTSTSPVVRGVWMLERLMGRHAPPPPPGVPSIEPDIRGAVSVLDQLEKHRQDNRCSSCHQLIDPPGVVMESFDVIGGYRDIYRALDPAKTEKKVRYSPDGPPPILYHAGQKVITENQMKDGRKFKNIEEFKSILLEKPEEIANNVLSKLMTYASGAKLSFSDKKQIKAIVQKTESSDYGFRSLIHELTQSELFQRK